MCSSDLRLKRCGHCARVTSAPPPLQLTRRLGVAAPLRRAEAILRVALTAEERTRLRGHRRSLCGRELLLQLPRGEPLEPGEWLAQGDGVAVVQVEPAAVAHPKLVALQNNPHQAKNWHNLVLHLAQLCLC